MTEKLIAFRAANAASPVVHGRVVGNGGKGAVYTLEDGRRFTLSAAECAQTLIRWYGEETVG
jgi:hypothetical protein